MVIICLPPKERTSSEPIIILHLDSLGMHPSTKILNTVGRQVTISATVIQLDFSYIFFTLATQKQEFLKIWQDCLVLMSFSVGDLLYSAQHYSISYTCCRYLEKEWRFLSVAWPCLLNDIRKEVVQVHTYTV